MCEKEFDYERYIWKIQFQPAHISTDEKRYIIRDTQFEAALSVIRFDKEEKIPSEVTRRRIKTMGISDDDIDDLFAQVNEEENTVTTEQ